MIFSLPEIQSYTLGFKPVLITSFFVASFAIYLDVFTLELIPRDETRINSLRKHWEKKVSNQKKWIPPPTFDTWNHISFPLHIIWHKQLNTWKHGSASIIINLREEERKDKRQIGVGQWKWYPESHPSLYLPKSYERPQLIFLL